MIFIGILIGIAFAIGTIFAYSTIVSRRFAYNLHPDWSKRGQIPKGTFDRFVSGFNDLFPHAPARSYISYGRCFDPFAGAEKMHIVYSQH